MTLHRPRNRYRLRCPDCGGRVLRVERTLFDHVRDPLRPLRRYRCKASACAWSGVLQTGPGQQRQEVAAPAAAAAPPAATPARARRYAAWTATALVAGVAIAYTATRPRAPLTEAHGPGGGTRVALGESDDGQPLPAAHPLAAAPPATPGLPGAEAPPLTLREGCAWGKPGRSPYTGTVEQALHAARLPPQVVAQMAAQVKAGQAVDRVVIGNEGIRAVRLDREFDARSFAMTYGRTLCVTTRVNFEPGHVEHGSLYEVDDASGRRYSVMVPDVCGNVSVLGQRAERKRRPFPPQLAAEQGPQLRYADVDYDDDWTPLSSKRQTVPEPSTLASALAALAALLWIHRRRRAANKR